MPARTHFACDHLAGIQPDPQREVDAVSLLYIDGEVADLLLDVQRSRARSNCMVFQ